MSKVSLQQQIAEVEREIALRKNVYPGFVTRKKMRQAEADEHLERMKAVSATLGWLLVNEKIIKDAISRANETKTADCAVPRRTD